MMMMTGADQLTSQWNKPYASNDLCTFLNCIQERLNLETNFNALYM